MKIGILGAGNIGGNMGRAFTRAGHQVRFGVRAPAKVAQLVEQCGGNASAGSPSEAARSGELVVLAVPWKAAEDVVRAVAADLSGKVLVDTTNALQWDAGPIPAVTDTSGAQRLAAVCPLAKVVKAFNTIGAEHLLAPKVGGAAADMFFCGDDAAAKGAVGELVKQLGFEPVDLGPLRNARLVEHLAITWIHLAMVGGFGRNIALKVVRG